MPKKRTLQEPVEAGQPADEGLSSGDLFGIWQPIESAPSDKKSDYLFALIAWGPEEDKSMGEGMRYKGQWFATGVFYNGRPHDERQLVFRELRVDPSHWMTRPSLPNSNSTT
jgi:hypothetical protein